MVICTELFVLSSRDESNKVILNLDKLYNPVAFIREGSLFLSKLQTAMQTLAGSDLSAAQFPGTSLKPSVWQVLKFHTLWALENVRRAAPWVCQLLLLLWRDFLACYQAVLLHKACSVLLRLSILIITVDLSWKWMEFCLFFFFYLLQANIWMSGLYLMQVEWFCLWFIGLCHTTAETC